MFADFRELFGRDIFVFDDLRVQGIPSGKLTIDRDDLKVFLCQGIKFLIRDAVQLHLVDLIIHVVRGQFLISLKLLNFILCDEGFCLFRMLGDPVVLFVANGHAFRIHRDVLG